jgi:hypothetical protein
VRIHALPGTVFGVRQVPGQLLPEERLRHRGQIHLDEDDHIGRARQRDARDGIRSEPEPTRRPKAGPFPLLPPRAVGEPPRHLDPLAHSQPDLGDRRGVGDEHPRGAPVSSRRPRHEPGTSRAQPPVPRRRAGFPPRADTLDQPSVVELVQPVPDGPLGRLRRAGHLAGCHHPVLVEQDEQLVRRTTRGTQSSEVRAVRHGATANPPQARMGPLW